VSLSILSFAGGNVHLPHVHFHLPHGHVTTPHLGGGPGGVGGGPELPLFNFGTITAFLAWFGGTGYLLTRHSSLLAMAIIVLSIVAGVVGAAIVFWFIVKFLLMQDHALYPADYDRVGVIGRISSAIRAGGTGEIIFAQAGTRQTCGARSEDGEALVRGTEVIITHYEHGIAYVRRWEELTAGLVDHRLHDNSVT
jgi:hypothetical protein